MDPNNPTPDPMPATPNGDDGGVVQPTPEPTMPPAPVSDPPAEDPVVPPPAEGDSGNPVAPADPTAV